MQFLDQNDDDMKLAWKVFDRKNVGFLEGKDFRKTLPLLGEDISEAKVTETKTVSSYPPNAGG